MTAVCQSHIAVCHRLAITEGCTLFYRHTHRVGVAGGGEQWEVWTKRSVKEE